MNVRRHAPIKSYSTTVSHHRRLSAAWTWVISGVEGDFPCLLRIGYSQWEVAFVDLGDSWSGGGFPLSAQNRVLTMGSCICGLGLFVEWRGISPVCSESGTHNGKLHLWTWVISGVEGDFPCLLRIGYSHWEVAFVDLGDSWSGGGFPLSAQNRVLTLGSCICGLG